MILSGTPTSFIGSILWEKDWHAGLNVMWQTKKSDHIRFDLGCYSVIETMAVPNGQFVNPADRQHNACDLVRQFKLLSDES